MSIRVDHDCLSHYHAANAHDSKHATRNSSSKHEKKKTFEDEEYFIKVAPIFST